MYRYILYYVTKKGTSFFFLQNSCILCDQSTFGHSCRLANLQKVRYLPRAAFGNSPGRVLCLVKAQCLRQMKTLALAVFEPRLAAAEILVSLFGSSFSYCL